MRRSLITILSLLLFSISLNATHQRAAEITFKHIEGLTYEIYVTTYTFTPSPADRPSLDIYWGDEQTGDAPTTIARTNKITVPNAEDITLNEYYGYRHTYPAPGVYKISFEDPNRNYGVVNIPNSVSVPMYVETELVINSFLGSNDSPILLNTPIDLGCAGRVYVHNPGAYDPDGDSLSYKLIACKGAGGLPIPGFDLPAASNSITLNPVTGDLVWDTPIAIGEYNIAFLVEEWRSGIRIGYVTRDMQIEVLSCANNPPEFLALNDTCVEAGQELVFDVTAVDPDGDYVNLTAEGGPFVVSPNPAEMDPENAWGEGEVTATFRWQTVCEHIKKQSYPVYFKARDENDTVNLVAYKTIQIDVIGPAPENLIAEPMGIGIYIDWDESICANAVGYKIYRRNGFYGYEPGYCETGVPAYTGYSLIETVEGYTITDYLDNNNGQGLVHGVEYCYMVTAYFEDGAESYASIEACAALKRDLPIITHVSNLESNLSGGNVDLKWAKPIDLDTLEYPGPYIYKVYRSEGLIMGDETFVADTYGLDDTLLIDTDVNLNQLEGLSYRVDLHSETVGYIGPSQPASSMHLSLYETDNEIQITVNLNVPWLNLEYIVYRKDEGQSTYDSIGFSPTPFYRDTNLVNGREYCYYIKSVGSYSSGGLVDPIINYSQLICGIPVDNVPPCPPELTVTSYCDILQNDLHWTNPNNYCSDDVVKYIIYYAPSAEEEFIRLDSTLHHADTNYLHRGLSAITACYYVTAVDTAGNESEASNMYCVNFDECPVYRLPNVFTPNGDDWNDFFTPFPESIAAVAKVDMKIYNRWGQIVFQTEDPMINWDGKNQDNNQDCAEGVYYYSCTVFEVTLGGLREREIKGAISLYR